MSATDVALWTARTYASAAAASCDEARGNERPDAYIRQAIRQLRRAIEEAEQALAGMAPTSEVQP